MRARSNQKRTVRSPDRIGYTVGYHAGIATNGAKIEQNILSSHELHLPPNLECPTSVPPFILVEICRSLLAYHLHVMAKSDGKDGLVVRSCGPIEVIDRFRCAAVAA